MAWWQMWQRWIGLAVFLCWTGIAAAGGPLYLWEVRDAKGDLRAWLFGTIHVCDAACFPLPAAVQGALATADSLALELDPEDPTMAAVLAQGAHLAPGLTLTDVLPAGLCRRLSQVAPPMGIDVAALQLFQPWMVSTLLTLRAAQAAGYGVEQGVDLVLARAARERGHPLWALETVERQVAALSAGGPAAQIRYLDEVVGMIEDQVAPRYFAAMLRAWKRGDVGAMDHLIREEYGGPQLAPLLDDLLDRRNAEMSEVIVRHIAAGERPFVAVGAGHFGGAGGLLARMQARGFTLRQVSEANK